VSEDRAGFVLVAMSGDAIRPHALRSQGRSPLVWLEEIPSAASRPRGSLRAYGGVLMFRHIAALLVAGRHDCVRVRSVRVVGHKPKTAFEFFRDDYLTPKSREARTSNAHMSLAGDAPCGRPVEPPNAGNVIALPRVGGLHASFRRRSRLLSRAGLKRAQQLPVQARSMRRSALQFWTSAPKPRMPPKRPEAYAPRLSCRTLGRLASAPSQIAKPDAAGSALFGRRAMQARALP
jgi:hypothetical protein